MLKIWRWLRRKCLIQVKNVCMYVSHRSQNMQIICINCANHAKMDKYESSECSLICKTLENLGSCNQFVPCILIIRSSCCAEENRTFSGSFVFSSFSWNLYDIIRRHSVCVCVPSFSMDNAAVRACMQLMAGVSSAGDNRAKQKGIYVNFHRKRLIAFCMLFIHNDGHKSISWINGCLTCYCHCMNAHQFKPIKYTFTFAITIKK